MIIETVNGNKGQGIFIVANCIIWWPLQVRVYDDLKSGGLYEKHAATKPKEQRPSLRS